MTDSRAISTGQNQGEAQVFRPYQSQYYSGLARASAAQGAAKQKTSSEALSRIPKLGKVEMLPAQQEIVAKKSDEVYKKIWELSNKIRQGDRMAEVEAHQLVGNYVNEAELIKQSKENFLNAAKTAHAKDPETGDYILDDISLARINNYTGVNEKGEIDYFDQSQLVPREQRDPKLYKRITDSILSKRGKEKSTIESQETGVIKMSGSTTGEKEIFSAEFDGLDHRGKLTVYGDYNKEAKNKGYYKDYARRLGFLHEDGTPDEEKAWLYEKTVPRKDKEYSSTYQEPSGQKNKFTDEDIQEEAQFNVTSLVTGQKRGEEGVFTPTESSSTGKFQLSVGKQGQTVTFSPGTIDLEGNILDKTAKVANANFGSISIVPVYKKGAKRTSGETQIDVSGTVVSDQDMKEAQEKGTVEWKPYAQGTAPTGRDASGKTMYSSFLQPLETVQHLFKGDTKDGQPLTEYYKQKTKELNTKKSGTAPYKNITTGQDASGNKITIGVRDGKWYDIKTGKAVE